MIDHTAGVREEGVIEMDGTVLEISIMTASEGEGGVIAVTMIDMERDAVGKERFCKNLRYGVFSRRFVCRSAFFFFLFFFLAPILLLVSGMFL